MPVRAAVFLITLSGLMFEIGLTRIYSATIWYHFTFVAVSVALLGWGLGGVAVHAGKRRWTPTLDRAGALAAGYGAAILCCLELIARLPATPLRLPLYFLAPLAPFLLGGMALAMIFDQRRQMIASLYFADLLGASLGAVGISVLLQTIGGEESVLVAALPPFAAAVCLSRRARPVALAGVAIVLAAAVLNPQIRIFDVTPGVSKAMRRQMDETPAARVTQTGWNAYSRIDAVEGFPPPTLARLYIDSDAWTNVLAWDGRLSSVQEMRSWFRALPFRFAPSAETLVIGPGGGADVVAALAAGSRHVTAVEMNPLMIRFVRHYGADAGRIYDRPDVELIQSEGRNFISRTDRRFDVIVLGFVDSFASVASGGLSLSENYLYTTEAFRAYYEHLTDGGLLAILRWNLDIPRLVSNAVATPRAAGGGRPARCRDGTAGRTTRRPATDALHAPKAPVHPGRDRRDRISVVARRIRSSCRGACRRRRTPTSSPPVISLAAYEAASPQRVGPVFDDSPFYFAISRPWGMNTKMAWTLFLGLLAPAAALLVVFTRAGRAESEDRRRYAASLLYFASLGFGFIAVELALLQYLTLLLGHPSFTLSVLLFTLLAAGGVGSALSRRFPVRSACVVVALLGAACALLLPHLVPRLLPWPLSARIAMAVTLLAPLGLAMGMPFPRGLQEAGRDLPAPAFYWGLNGIMSVIGSVITVLIAVSFGFRSGDAGGKRLLPAGGGSRGHVDRKSSRKGVTRRAGPPLHARAATAPASPGTGSPARARP